MKHPFLVALGVGVTVIVAAFLPAVWHMAGGPQSVPPTAPQQDAVLPWQVQVQDDGSSRVMGLHLGVDTLAQARARAGESWQLAIVARAGELGALEALSEPFSAGFVTGRLVMAFEVPVESLRRWREASPGSAAMEGGVRRLELSAEHQAEAAGVPLSGLSFVPVARLSREDVRQRFGAPAQERTLADGATWLAYPALGLTATVAEGRRGVLQYVAPRDAPRLLEPPAPAGSQAPGASAPETGSRPAGG